MLGVFGAAALKIKNTIQLWPDEVERRHGLSDVQREMLVRMCDGLQNDLHQIFITAPLEGQSRSTIEEYEGEVLEEVGRVMEDEEYDELL